jgi:hypothetical protein
MESTITTNAPAAAAATVDDVREALDAIPAAEKAAYAQAVELAPRLVEIESNPER